MQNKSIFDSALRLLAESTEPCDVEDYAERAPYLLATFCTEVADVDAALRKMENSAPAKSFHSVFMPLQDTFPLLPRFSSAAAYYLAAMLIIDEDADASDRFYDKYCDSISKICASLQAISHPIKNKYFAD